MNTWFGRTIVAGVLASLCTGSSCTVAYCSEDCNPCYSECKCHDRPCRPSTTADFQSAHELTAFRQSIWLEPGRTTCVRSEIVGLSVARATGKSDVDAGDLARFAEGVLRVNAAQLQAPAGARWAFDGIQTFDAVSLVNYESRPEGSTLSLLFDGAGNLIEIDEVLAAR
ncbi:MAG: hypothetical protein ACKVWV_12805 [Planctomycetota bacterium]